VRLELELSVTLKDGLLDPQGKTVLEALPTMGWSNVSEVRVGKLIRMTLDADDEASGRAQAEEIGQRLLANPVIEDVRVLDVREAVS
jgi:phosphoribosylformylglycinamidine synthase